MKTPLPIRDSRAAGVSRRHSRWRHPGLLLIPILLLGIYLRHFAFFLPANNGDPIAYQSLAMKLNHGFMRHYDIFHFRSQFRGKTGLVDYVWEENPKKMNAQRTRAIYHLPLHIQPPLFPILIWVSHGILKYGEAYTSIAVHPGESIFSDPPWELAAEQAYAILPPFLASVGLILLVYFFCLRFYSWREGLIAAAMMTVSPLDISVGTKMYADGILSFLVFSALFLYFHSLEAKGRPAWFWAALAGIALGLAYLSKVSGMLFAFGFLIATLLREGLGLRQILAPQLWIAGACALGTASPWLGLMYHHYGQVLLPTPEDPRNSWYRFIFGRPLRAYPLDLLWFHPFLSLGALTGLVSLRAARRFWKECALGATAFFYIGMFLYFAVTRTAGVEDRYLLPVYPLLSVLTGIGALRLLEAIRPVKLRRWAWGLFVVLMVISAWRSAQIGMEYSLKGGVVFTPLGY